MHSRTSYELWDGRESGVIVSRETWQGIRHHGNVMGRMVLLLGRALPGSLTMIRIVPIDAAFHVKHSHDFWRLLCQRSGGSNVTQASCPPHPHRLTTMDGTGPQGSPLHVKHCDKSSSHICTLSMRAPRGSPAPPVAFEHFDGWAVQVEMFHVKQLGMQKQSYELVQSGNRQHIRK